MSTQTRAVFATEQQIADWFNISKRSLAAMRKNGQAPKHITFNGGQIRYPWSTVHKWAQEKVNES